MNILTRVVSLLFVLLLTVSLFGACGKKDDSASADTGDPTEVLSTADVNFITDGESTYRVIRPDGASNEVNSAAMSVHKALKSTFNISPANASDTEDGEGRAEILVGETNREASAKAKEILKLKASGRSDEFIICTIDDDIVILGSSDTATVSAANYFIDNYMTSATITGGINFVYNTAANYSTVTICGNENLSDFTIVRPIYNVSYITQAETDKLIEDIFAKTGYRIDLVHDQVASNLGGEHRTDGSGTLTPTEATEYEIIIGNCVRDGVKTITDLDEYEIRIEDKKIYLNGGSPYATAMAVSEFIKIFANNTAITSDMTVSSGDYTDVIDNYDTAEYYRPTWYDEFNGVSTDIDPDGFGIDYTKWRVPWDMQSSYSSAPNGKTQYRCNKNLHNTYVENGCLYMCAIETSDAYYGGWFDTTTTMYYRYGYLENSTLHPKGIGFWNALWSRSSPSEFADILPAECKDAFYSLETDVDECYGNGDWAYGNTFAWPTSYGKQQLQIPTGQNGTVHVNNSISAADDRGFFMDFHTFGFEWIDNTHVRFTCDGYVYVDQMLREGAEQIAYSQPGHIILGYAVGSGNHGTPTTDPDEWTNTNKFVNDWVYIYQLSGQDLYYPKNNGGWQKVN